VELAKDKLKSERTQGTDIKPSESFLKKDPFSYSLFGEKTGKSNV
jgi:hypothetical protein